MEDTELNDLVRKLKPELLKELKKDPEVKGPGGKPGVMGPEGPEGKVGTPGQKGDIGPVGPTGHQGAPGDRGPQGPGGPRGDRGEAGHDGSRGGVGPQGARGIDGREGAHGERGFQGPQGNVGARGPIGEPGQNGVAGANYSCRAFTADPSTINPGEWTTMQFSDDNWDSGSFHTKQAPGNQYLSIQQQGQYCISATVDGVSKIRIVHIGGDNKETVVAQRTGDYCATEWKARQRDRFRVDVLCDNTWGVNPSMASPVFLIRKVDKSG